MKTTLLFSILVSINLSVSNSLEVKNSMNSFSYGEKTNEIFLFDLDNNDIGFLWVFNNGEKYFAFNHEHEILDINYNFNSDVFNELMELQFDKINYYYNNTVIYSRLDENLKFKGGNIAEKFHPHYDYDFMTSKTRYLQYDWDSPYATRANTTNAIFKNKLTWSIKQNNNNYCGPIAVTNLVWTFGMNGTVDLGVSNYTSQEFLVGVRNAIFNYEDDTTYAIMITEADNCFTNHNYIIDYCNVANGISDNLNSAPIIGLYSDDITDGGHYALITGKGRSVYMSIGNIKFYTSWDIVNTYEDTYDKDETHIYLKKKHWVDNQYLRFGWNLKTIDGDVVSL